MRRHSSKSRPRCGVATVEFVLILPLIMLMVFGALEIGRAVMVQHVLEEAARAGCRVATLYEGTEQEARSMVDTAMNNANITGYSVSVVPDPLTTINRKTPVTVTVSVPYSAVTWMPSGWFMGNKTLVGACTMPADRDVSGKKKAKAKVKVAKNKKKAKSKKAKAKAKAKAKKK